MLDQAISQFFEQRKEAWLKKNISASMSDEEMQQQNLECDRVFSPSHWLPNAAKRAGQISISTHPCTFSHPSSRKNKNGYASSIIADSEQHNDGFLRSGNVSVAADALGNAAALDVYKYLMLELEDGNTLLSHLQQGTEKAQVALAITNPSEEQHYVTLRDGFLAMVTPNEEVVTSAKIKQVYFPTPEINDDYHQLSILTPSGIVFDLRKRLDNLRFGDEVKACRDNRKNSKQGPSYKEIYDLTTIGYGGTKPQNISVLNNANGGKAHLFMSMPPTLENHRITFPTKDFFTQSIYYNKCRKTFLALHDFYLQDKNNMQERAARDELYQDIIDDIIEVMWSLRGVGQDQFLATHSALSAAQRVWLEVSVAPDDDRWLDEILKHITHFIYHGYEKVLDKAHIKIGDAEYKHIGNVVELNREVLR
jgi:CRISPR-associated protein Csy1